MDADGAFLLAHRAHTRRVNSKILIVDDFEETATLMRDGLRARGFAAEAVSSGRECLDYLKEEPVDVVITDVVMPMMSGIELCELLRDRHPEVLPIVLTGDGALATAVAAIRAGAYDYVAKPANAETLAIAVSRALSHLELKREVKRLRSTAVSEPIDGIAGHSPAIRATIDLVRRVADSDATTVVISGESGIRQGAGREALHRLSSRHRDQPFVAVNCAAIPASLLESELFGHVRGAFTDAKSSRGGLFVQAGSGTIFLDEITEMPLDMQAKILRVRQEHRVRAVGADEEVPFQARVIAATNRDLEAEIAAKRFRGDLFYRLNVVGISVPALRDRGGDILVLAQRFLDRIALRIHKAVRGISAIAARALMEYDWPGNVRELENCMERAVALCRLDEITLEDLPVKIQSHRSARFSVTATSPCELITLEEMERRYVRQVLNAMAGNKTNAARAPGWIGDRWHIADSKSSSTDDESRRHGRAAAAAAAARRLSPGQRDHELRTEPGLALDPNRPAVRLYDLIGDIEAEPEAGRGLDAADPLEGSK